MPATSVTLRPESERLLLQRHWEAARRDPDRRRRRRPRRRRCDPALRRLHRPGRRPARPSGELARRRAVDRRRHRGQPVARDRHARRGRRSRHPPARPTGQMSRIVVTGGSGRLGRTLAAGLAQRGHEVVSFDRAASDALSAANVEQVAARPDGCRGHRTGSHRRAGRRGDPPRRDRRAVQRAGGRDPPHERRARDVGARRCGAGRHPQDRRRVEPDRARLRGAEGLDPRPTAPRRGLAHAPLERLRPVEAAHRAVDRDAAAPDRRRRAVRRLPPLLRHRPGGMGGRTDPAGAHRARAARRPGAVGARPVQLRRRPRCRDLRRHAAGRPRRHPERRGLLRRRRRCARPRAARRACSPVSIPAPRPPPRRSPERARPSRTRRRERLLGWTPRHDWRTELARADDRTDVHA